MIIGVYGNTLMKILQNGLRINIIAATIEFVSTLVIRVTQVVKADKLTRKEERSMSNRVILAEVARQEALKMYHGNVMTVEANIHPILHTFRSGRYKKQMACGVPHLCIIAVLQRGSAFPYALKSVFLVTLPDAGHGKSGRKEMPG